MLCRVAVALSCSVALLAGCRNSRDKPSVSRPAVPHGTHIVRYKALGVSFRAPNNWSTLSATAPLVATVGSGKALVSLWRYPRPAPAPADVAELAHVRAQRLAAERARYPPLHLIRARLVTIDGARGIEIDAVERIQGQVLRVRQVHVFAFGAEWVLDEYSPREFFPTTDHLVFSPLKRSLRLFPAGRR